jgi:CheY-like chemotaxis protein
LRIRDTGKGIPAAYLPHIFEQFSQADSSSVRAHGGLGIGLALVDKLVKLQGGTVDAQSDGEGKGATFTVHFPLSSAAQFAPDWYEQPTVGDTTADDLSRQLDLTGFRILFVDDEASALHAIKEMLSSFGAEVRLASSSAEAIAEFEKATPDVLVSDIAMPLEDGYSLIRKIRRRGSEKGGNTPAVALTAYADAQSRELTLSAGYQAHLAKPVDSNELVQTILKARKTA